MSANAARDVADRLREIRALAESDAPMAACNALGEIAETTVKTVLTAREHTEGTPTPSDPGSPPAKISGDLAASMHKTPPQLISPGCAQCQVGSVLVYAAVHEHGPVTIRSKGNWPLRNRKTGQVFGQSVVIPRRPYFEAAVRLLQTGIALKACEDAWQSIIDI